MTSWRMVYKMAAVGCSSMGSEEMGEKFGTSIALMCKKNGINHGCYCEDKIDNRINSKSNFLDKIKRLNGSVKTNNNNSFCRPSIPTLRSGSKRERRASGSESTKRKRRSSRTDKGETVQSVSTDTGQIEASLNCHAQTCNSVSPTKEKQPSLVSVNHTLNHGFGQVTPDTSRSCTPLSIGGLPASGLGESKGSHSSLSKPSGNISSGSSKPSGRDGVQCQWKDCDKKTDVGEIMDHIRLAHVEPQGGNETFVCLWNGCKVYNKSSLSRSWIDRHILTHSGVKPFRCIVEGCGMRFTSQSGLERHVNSHFSAQELTPNSKHPKQGREDTPTKLWKRKRLKQKGRPIVKTIDYFDSGIMERLHHQLSNIAEKTQLDLNGSTNSVTFHSTVIARRTESSGKVKVLLHWTPEDILPDSWVLESQVPSLQSCSIPVNQLPRDTVLNLHHSLYNEHRYRKHRRK